MSRTAAKVTQADVARALRAVEQTGASAVIEIAPDGTIRIVPAALAGRETRKLELDDESPVDL